MPAARLAAAFWIAAVCAAQSGLAPEVLQLAKIKQRMKEHLSRIANFTCLETIERSRPDRSGRMKQYDVLRLEVAFVNGKELYSWLGAGKFEESSIGAFTKGGTIGGGLFASHARSIFVDKWPTYHYAGRDSVHGRAAVRYDYVVPLLGSGYVLNIAGHRAAVGFSGAFWADEETLQVLRLTIRADDVPIRLGVTEALQSIDYGRVRLNDVDFLLPQSAETTLVYIAGARSRNRTQFSHWQRYVGESTLVFDDAPAAGAKPETKIDLPAGLTLSTRLEGEIRSSQALDGDPIVAKVDQDARWKGKVIVLAGAKLAGRIRTIEKREGGYTVTLEFFELQLASRRTRFFAGLAEVKGGGGLHRVSGAGLGIATIEISGPSFRLGDELHMVWKMGPP